MSVDDRELVSPTWIARTSGVTASTVSNWQRRHPDFPSRVGDTGRFDRAEVLAWLSRRGIETGPRAQGRIDRWRLIDAVRGLVPSGQLVHVFTRTVVLEHLRRSAMAGLALARSNEVRVVVPASTTSVEDIAEWVRTQHPTFLAGLFAVPERDDDVLVQARLSPLLHDEPDLLRVVDDLLTRERGLGGASAHRSAGLLGLAASGFTPTTIKTVLDPAVGYGIVPVGIARDRAAKAVIGCEIDLAVGQIFLSRALLAGVDAILRTGDALLMSDELRGLADLVVLAPPLGVPLSEAQRAAAAEVYDLGLGTRDADVLWLRLAEAARRPGGVAVVQSASNTAVRAGAATEVRRGLVESGALTSVVGLPSGFVDGSAIPSLLWVLDDRSTDDRIVFIDASSLDAEPAARVVGQRVAVDPMPEVGIISGGQVLDARVNLAPKRWSERRVEGFDQARVELLNAKVADLPRLDRATVDGSMPRLLAGRHELSTMRDLVRGKSVKYWAGSITGAADASLEVLVADASWVAHPGTTARASMPQGRVPHENLMLQQGDLLISRGRDDVHAHVWHDTRPAVVGSGVYLVRVTDESLLPEFLQLCMLSRTNRRFAEGERMRDLDLDEFIVPQMTREQQSQAVETWRTLQTRVDAMTAAANRTKWATVDVLDALTSGAGLDA